MVLISAEELARIAEHLDMSEAAVRSRYLAASGDRLANGPDSRCVFLSDGRVTSCRIYPARPERCRTWPYWDQLRDSASALTEAARLCAGIDLSAHDDR